MLNPLHNRVVIQRDPVTKEINGILIAEAAQKPELTGTVIATGPKVTDVKVGDRVLFGKPDGVPVDSKYIGSSGQFIIMEETQIRGILSA